MPVSNIPHLPLPSRFSRRSPTSGTRLDAVRSHIGEVVPGERQAEGWRDTKAREYAGHADHGNPSSYDARPRSTAAVPCGREKRESLPGWSWKGFAEVGLEGNMGIVALPGMRATTVRRSSAVNNPLGSDGPHWPCWLAPAERAALLISAAPAPGGMRCRCHRSGDAPPAQALFRLAVPRLLYALA